MFRHSSNRPIYFNIAYVNGNYTHICNFLDFSCSKMNLNQHLLDLRNTVGIESFCAKRKELNFSAKDYSLIFLSIQITRAFVVLNYIRITWKVVSFLLLGVGRGTSLRRDQVISELALSPISVTQSIQRPAVNIPNAATHKAFFSSNLILIPLLLQYDHMTHRLISHVLVTPQSHHPQSVLLATCSLNTSSILLVL